jgi:hypothetical protein
MTKETVSTRRSFLKQSALIAGPIAAVGVPAVALAGDAKAARLTQLEDEAAIRGLHRNWLRHVNNGANAAPLFADPRRAALDAAISGVFEDHAGEPLAIRLSADGARATGTLDCAVELEFELPLDCTLAQMAHAQGEGRVRHSERRVLTADYVKLEGGWAIARLELAAA